MVFVAGITLAFYLMQQFGMMLGVGAEMVLLFTYLIGRRIGVINETEDGIAHGIYHILIFSLSFIIISGVGITGIHLASGQTDILFAPAFVIKWLLIVVAVIFAFLLRGFRIWNSFLEGIAGANWGALFLLHIFAPITTYFVLIKLYAEFAVIFLIGWYVILLSLRLKPLVLKSVAPQKKNDSPQPATKSHSSAFAALFAPLLSISIPFDIPFLKKQTIPQPQATDTSTLASHIPTQPQPIIFSPERTSQLSPLRVMPQSEEELKQHLQEDGITES